MTNAASDRMRRPPKTVAAIHDLSSFGRCALSVIMPSLSAMGAQVVPVPTALLSTHTGGFENMYFLDLSRSMEPIADHFDELGLTFDSIYTGFLGSAEQIDIVSDFIKRFSRRDTVVMVDPVMGDDGELYSTYTDEMRDRMSELCKLADIITPNLTEACFLAGIDYTDTEAMDEQEAKAFADGLSRSLLTLGCKKIVITGVAHSHTKFGTYGYDAEKRSCGYMYSVDRVRRSYPGTGDLFSSVLLGGVLRGYEFDNVLRFASDYVRRVMDRSSKIDSPPTPVRNGVAFEYFMGELAEYSGD